MSAWGGAFYASVTAWGGAFYAVYAAFLGIRLGHLRQETAMATRAQPVDGARSDEEDAVFQNLRELLEESSPQP
jgi:hypothetical protein